MADFTIPISRFKGLTQEDALGEEWDVIPALTAFQETVDFCLELERRRSKLERLVARHLGIAASDVTLLEQREWIWGSFNICLPVLVDDATARRAKLPVQVVLRLPLPFRSGETYSPGNVDEKLRCEAATYIWMAHQCPSIPIPRLLGMGFPNSHSWTPIENASIWTRFIWRLSSYWRSGLRAPFSFFARESDLSDLGYLLLEYIVHGRPLSSSWQDHRLDPNRRSNLYQSLAKVFLALMKSPLPRIGSWTIDDHDTKSQLTYLGCAQSPLMVLPPADESVQNRTYTSPSAFVDDLLGYQDSRMRHQDNSIIDRRDGIGQLAILAYLQNIRSKLWDDLQHSAFVLTLPDLHQSNIFVDEDWNITSLIDLEFAPVQSTHMVHVPAWLSDRGIDELVGPALHEYKTLYDRFVEILEEEEGHDHTLSEQLREDWNSGMLWYNTALRSTNAFPQIFMQHLQPHFWPDFSVDADGEALMTEWDAGWKDFIVEKLRKRMDYERRIQELFKTAKENSGPTRTLPS